MPEKRRTSASRTRRFSSPDFRSGLARSRSTRPVKGSFGQKLGQGVTPWNAGCYLSPTMAENHSENTLDLSGLLCPLPVLKARKRLESHAVRAMC